jgi:transposase
MAYKYGNREQITFLPEAIESYVTDDDPVRVYDAFIDALDLKELGVDVDEDAVGNSSYDPSAMLKILVYGYSYGWRSSRKLERALHHNLSFIWIAGGLKPDHKTISNFRKDNKQALKNTLKQCARLCLKLNLIEGNTLFVDGSKFRANAGKSQTKTIESWETYRKHVERQIEKLLDECQQLDENEQESLVQVSKELKGKKALKSKIDQLFEEINESEPKTSQKDRKVNGTDPDCKIMKGRQGSHASYNNQMVVDDENGLIVSMDATTAANDLNQLKTQITQVEEVLEKSADTVCADAGYSSVEDLKDLVDQQKVVVVPNNAQAQKTPRDPFAKDAFKYNEATDTYTCPVGEEFFRTDRIDGNRYEYRMRKSTTCRGCTHFGDCTSAKTGRRLYRLVNEETKKALERIYESPEGQEIYRRRKMRVEHPFGHIKRNLGAGAFLLRGLEGVNAEINILGTCFNIARMISILGGVRPAIARLKLV